MGTRPPDGELPIGGAGLGVDEDLEFLRKEDLAAFPVPDSVVLAGTPGQTAPGPSGGLTVASVAASYDVNPRELYRSVRRQLEQALLGGVGLAREFRLAMLRLCQAELGAGDVDA